MRAFLAPLERGGAKRKRALTLAVVSGARIVNETCSDQSYNKHSSVIAKKTERNLQELLF